MDNLSNISSTGEHYHASDHPDNLKNNRHPTKADLIHSAKVLADVAQSQLRHEPGKYDKAQVAGATADLLNSASEYGKLDDNRGIGKYVDKAEDYLRNYQTSHPVDQMKAMQGGGGQSGHGGKMGAGSSN